MKSYLIADTTREEREQIVEESLGNISGSCDGCRESKEHRVTAKRRGCLGASPPLFCIAPGGLL